MLRRRGSGAVLGVVVALALASCGHATRSASSQSEGSPLGATTTEPALSREAPPLGDVAIAPPPSDLGAGSPPPPSSQCAAPPAAGNARGTGTWAVVIGINRYPSGRYNLQSAVPDAQDVDEALSRFGVPADHRLVLTDGVASGCRVIAAADWLVAHAGPGSTAVFFYAGHARKLGPGSEALIAADGMLITDVELARHLAGLQSARTWIGMSACFGGGFDELLGPGRVLTAAAGPNNLAYENEGFHRSYLVQYMVRKAMIEGAAPDTIQQSYDWAYGALHGEYPNRMPFQIDRAGGPVDIHQPGASRLVAAAPPASPAGNGGSGSGPKPPTPSPTAPVTTVPPPPDNCSGLTLGVVHCKK